MNKQLSLFPEYEAQSGLEGLLKEKNLGTFQDSLKAPIHRWFKYPAGYSYQFIETFLTKYNLDHNSWVLDPFVGSGTTTLTAKQFGVNSVGIEAHPFVHWVASVKCFWEYDLADLRQNIKELLSDLEKMPAYPGQETLQEFPELIHKCYSAENLWRLKFIRDTIENFPTSEQERNFFKLALTDTLRTVSSAGTGWPYIAPTKYQEKKERPALEMFSKTVYEMYSDIWKVRAVENRAVITKIHLRDARKDYQMPTESIDLAITSPPEVLNVKNEVKKNAQNMVNFGRTIKIND